MNQSPPPMYYGRLRDGRRVKFFRLPCPLGCFTLHGVDQHGHPHLWQDTGAWREDGRRDAQDLVLNQPKALLPHP